MNRILAYMPNRTPQQIRKISEMQIGWLDWLYFVRLITYYQREHAVRRVIDPLYKSEAE